MFSGRTPWLGWSQGSSGWSVGVNLVSELEEWGSWLDVLQFGTSSVSGCVLSVHVEVWPAAGRASSPVLEMWLLREASPISDGGPLSLKTGADAPESTVWLRPRGQSLTWERALWLFKKLLTSTVSPRCSLLWSGFTCREKTSRSSLETNFHSKDYNPVQGTRSSLGTKTRIIV